MKIRSAVFTAAFGALVASSALAATILPADTIIQLTPSEEINSKVVKQGDQVHFQIANDVLQDGTVVIPHGAPVIAEVTWRTGKGIGGKSAKFEVTFRSVTVNGHAFNLKGKSLAEGRGNTVGALLGSMLITGRSAVMMPGEIVNGFTAEQITVG